ncbi:MAG: antibiotic biosynthesis monooxygenase [Chitinophagaceae bacterium]|nr:antibiotic biosynthesis monooxygenase [Chitinophagaceae bacterium]MCB9045348.1 antibiotic biosynthesis monooxygenase [Chitinophagales bacterium]
MIVRIVKMSFREEEVNNFLTLFNERKELIRHFDGCHHLELWQQAGNETVYFTYSIWDSEQHLDHYRFSELFKDTWKKTKALFADKPQAWSVEQRIVVS